MPVWWWQAISFAIVFVIGRAIVTLDYVALGQMAFYAVIGWVAKAKIYPRWYGHSERVESGMKADIAQVVSANKWERYWRNLASNITPIWLVMLLSVILFSYVYLYILIYAADKLIHS